MDLSLHLLFNQKQPSSPVDVAKGEEVQSELLAVSASMGYAPFVQLAGVSSRLRNISDTIHSACR